MTAAAYRDTFLEGMRRLQLCTQNLPHVILNVILLTSFLLKHSKTTPRLSAWSSERESFSSRHLSGRSRSASPQAKAERLRPSDAPTTLLLTSRFLRAASISG